MTAVLNIITWNKAYCVFARETLVQRKTFMLKPVDEYFEKLLRKYHERGFIHEQIIRAEDHSPTSGLQRVRRIGDEHTLVLKLPTDGVRPKNRVADTVIEYSGFDLSPISGGRNRAPICSYEIGTTEFRHLALQHAHCVPTNLDWWDFLGPRLHDAAKMGLLVMKPADRPNWFANRSEPYCYYPNLGGEHEFENFQKPTGWRDHDVDIPRWYNQWYSQLAADKKKLEMTPTHLSGWDWTVRLERW
jgi:hypothetical protein